MTASKRNEPGAQAQPPVSADAPCGPSLEYDNDFLVLQAQLQPVTEVQYGDFTGRRDGPDWADVERQCVTLLARSIDINLLVWLLRARTRQAGAQGLLEGLVLLVKTLERYPQQIHPQLDMDDAPSPELRANALAAVGDSEGLVGDVRALWVRESAVARLSVRDVERAFSVPRAPDAMSSDQVALQLQELREQQDPIILSLQRAEIQFGRLTRWIADHLPEQPCDMEAMSRLLHPFASVAAVAASKGVSATTVINSNTTQDSEAAVERPGVQSVANLASDHMTSSEPAPEVASRSEARLWIARARDWFETNEPSSPVGVLLRQAEHLVGRRYAEVASAIPVELLARWEAQHERT